MSTQHLVRRVALCAGIAGLGVAGIGAGAGAQPAPAQAAGRLMVSAPGRLALGATTTKPTDSTFQGAYTGPVPSGVATTTLSLQTTVPTATCSASGTAGMNLLDGVLEYDASTDYFIESGDLIGANCSGGTASYYALAIADNSTDGTSIAVSPGDVIDVSVSVASGSDTTSAEDATTGQSSEASGSGFSPTAAQVSTQESTGGPSFTPVTYTSVLVDGAGIGTTDPTRYQEVDGKDKVEVKTSKLTEKGSEFTNTYVRSS